MKPVFAAVLLFLSACGSPVSESATLRLSFNTSPATLDPRKSGDFVSSTLIRLIFDGLTRCLPGGDVEPALAQRIDISPDGLLYTFHLRKAYWTDGHPVAAQDFERSWKKILDPSFSSLCAYLLFPIKNAEKCAKGEAPLSEVGIQSIDSRTLRVELERPAPFFLSLTAFPLYLPIPSHTEQDPKRPPVCNGPFRIDSLIPNSEIRLVKNRRFWNVGHISLDAIHISVIPDENTAFQMFEQTNSTGSALL